MSTHPSNEDDRLKLKPIISHDQNLKVIYLQWSDVSSGLIIKAHTGIAFCHQTGGYSCTPSMQEGVLIPLTLLADMKEKLDLIFLGKYDGWCDSGIDQQDAGSLDSIFRAHNFPMVVDRKLLKESKEAWIHAILTNVDAHGNEHFHALVEFSGEQVIFIFENSD